MSASQEPLVAEAPGVRITACPRGAHLMTWTTDGVERLWMSPLSACGDEQAIRGGVPVLFPQFAAFGPLVKHGFARTTAWQPVDPSAEEGRAVLGFELSDSPATRAVWDHGFHLRLVASASAADLRMTLTVTNTGHEAFRFTGGLHGYYAVVDTEAWISGLAGARQWDGVSTEHPRFTVGVGQRIRALDEQDRVMHGAVAPIGLHDAVLGELRLHADGFSDRVVWNPGPRHRLADVPPGGETGFVCIEPAAVTPVTLPGGGIWEGRQVVEVR